MGTFSLICTRNDSDQAFHLDLMKPEDPSMVAKQCAMNVSEGDCTPVACVFDCERTTNETDLCDVLCDSVKANEEHNWLVPSQETEIYIKNKIKSSRHLNEILEQGFGSLFRLWSDNCTTCAIDDAPAGATTALESGVMHKGSGAKGKNTRSILFWTHSSTGTKSHNPDSQFSPLTLMIEIAAELWQSLKTDVMKQEMLQLVCHCFVTSDKSHRETIISTEIVPRTTEVPQFLKRMTAHKKSIPNLKKTIKNFVPKMFKTTESNAMAV